MIYIRPQKGPQEAFLSSSADIVIYGGAAGGGKTFGLVMEAVRHVDNPKFGAVLFRRTNPQLTGAGSVWEETQGIYPHLGGKSRETPHPDWKFPSGSLIEFRHMQHEKDKLAHQGKQYALIMFDELTHFTAGQWWYMFSRNRTTCGVRPYIRATTNPDPDSFVRKLIDWWIGKDGYPIKERSGIIRWFVRVNDEIVWENSEEEISNKHFDSNGKPILPTSFTFIAAKLEDNPALTTKDPGYEAKLMAMPRVEREQLLGGNWDVRPSAGNFFKRSYFEVIEVPLAHTVRKVRAWDLAGTKPSTEYPDPDATAGILFSIDSKRQGYIEHVEWLRDSPSKVDDAILNTARADGPGVVVVLWQDPGSAGKAQVEALTRMLAGFIVRVEKASKDKVTYASPVSSQAERGNISVVRGHWNDEFFTEVEGFPDAAHDDRVDALSLAFLECYGNNIAIWEGMLTR